MTCSLPTDQQLSRQETWSTALRWVSSNKSLIRQIASPYIKFMVGDYEDLYQEAAIASVKALITSKKKESPERFIPFFRVIFKTSCIKLASGIQTVHCLEDYLLPCPEEPNEETSEPEEIEIEQALQAVSKRQREICRWLLQQSTPASTPDIAREFNISRRHACRVVSESIQKIEGTIR